MHCQLQSQLRFRVEKTKQLSHFLFCIETNLRQKVNETINFTQSTETDEQPTYYMLFPPHTDKMLGSMLIGCRVGVHKCTCFLLPRPPIKNVKARSNVLSLCSGILLTDRVTTTGTEKQMRVTKNVTEIKLSKIITIKG